MNKFVADPKIFSDMLIETLIELNPGMSENYIKVFVEKVVETDAGFISKEYVLKNQDFCKQCGICCKDMDCPELNGKLCGIWYRRPEICSLYPYWEVPGEAHGIHFVPMCSYAFKVVLYRCMKILRKEL